MTSASAEPQGSESRFRVLVFPGGTELGLEIGKALAFCKEVALYSAGADVGDHAEFAFRRHCTLPDVRTAGWLDALNGVIRDWSITHILPAHDDVMLALARHAREVAAKVVTSPAATCEIARSKSATYRHFADVVPVPQLWNSVDEVPQFPVFVKPDRGQGTQHAARVDSREELELLLRTAPKRIICEYLSGAEYTVDCFSDRRRGLLFCGPRVRERTRAGIAMRSTTIDEPELRDWAVRIAARLEFHGAWFFQAKRDAAGRLKLLEVAPRPAGTSALHRALGVNFPLLSLYEAEGEAVEILPTHGTATIERALVNRYRHALVFDTVYVDLDDTLIFRGAVHPPAAAFLYQCLNRGVRLVLITRRAVGLEETLRRYRLQSLFDEIVYVPRGTPKSERIRAAGAILIDDSFAERRQVHGALGIPTFDLSMLELLLDDRV